MLGDESQITGESGRRPQEVAGNIDPRGVWGNNSSMAGASGERQAERQSETGWRILSAVEGTESPSYGYQLGLNYIPSPERPQEPVVPSQLHA